MIRPLLVLAFLASTFMAALPAAARSAPACRFVLGFATLHDLIPNVVGNCLDDEQHNPANGDALQQTTGGLLVWRKADNFTAFTDGFHTWVNGPDGVQERLNTQRFAWEANPGHLPLATSPGADWPTYYHDASRSAVDPESFAGSAAASLWQSTALDGDMYAEPLIAGGHVLVATENNTVYALDPTTGQVQWSTHLGTPVPGGSLPCGNIDPVGITSTPVVDPSTGAVYVTTFEQPGHYNLVALDLNSGAIRFRRLVDPPGADTSVLGQRAALALTGGVVYVSFGGRYGDCGTYHGWVVGVRGDGSGSLQVYQVPSNNEGAIWAPPGPVVANDGTLYVATGNSSSNTTFDYGNSVLHLSPDLRLLDWFAPSDWAPLNDQDLDVGSMSPTLLNNDLLFQSGKSGTGYLLRADRLGGIGGQVFSGPVCNGAYGGSVYQAPYLYVSCLDGLVALRLDNRPGFSVAWRGPRSQAGPPIIAGGVVWSVAWREVGLYGFNPQSGQVVAHFPLSPAAHFTSPAAAGGRIYVESGQHIVAFGS